MVDDDLSDDDVVAFVNTKCVNIDENDPPDCLEGDDERLIQNSTDTFATDRRTALAVDDEKYLADGAVPHEGLVNKWPFDAEKKTYPYWNGTLGTAVDAEYVGTRDIDGLETYEYHTVVPETTAEVLEGTQGLYSTEETIWIEPKTGSIIDQEGGQVLKLENGDVILDIAVSYTDETVADQRGRRQGQRQSAEPADQHRAACGPGRGPAVAGGWLPAAAPPRWRRAGRVLTRGALPADLTGVGPQLRSDPGPVSAQVRGEDRRAGGEPASQA